MADTITLTIGNGVVLQGTFKDRNGVARDVTGVAIRIYDESEEQIGEDITEDITNVSTGVYEYSYTVPLGHEWLVVEFSGVYDSAPIVGRKKAYVVWVD